MDKAEAKAILDGEIARARKMTYDQLQGLIGDSQHIEVSGESGLNIRSSLQAWWDDKLERNLRVIASIDDSSLLRAMVPLSSDFIVAPDGSFVGE